MFRNKKILNKIILFNNNNNNILFICFASDHHNLKYVSQTERPK